MSPVPNPTDTARALVEAYGRAERDCEAATMATGFHSEPAFRRRIDERDNAKAALLAHVAELTEALSDAAEALEHVRGESQHCDCYAFDVAQNVLNKHSGFALATRPTEARDDG